MTKKEAAVIETYTGIAMLSGENRAIVDNYHEELMGRKIFTHEYGNPEMLKKLRELSKTEFMEICKNLTD